MRWTDLACVGVFGASGCVGAPEGLRETPAGTGPAIVVDFDAEPLPDIPFPNDLATRPDPTSVTGKRLNLPLTADLRVERHSREGLNRATGFGVYAPISVSFEGPLDLDALFARHPDDLHVPGHFDDDAILLINVDPDHPDFGKAFPLDLGQGRFPQQMTRSFSLLLNDPHDGPALLFDTIDEDADGDGVFDSGEDSDGDGVFDVPNVYPPGGDRFYDLMTAYDLASDTLVVRPVVPLAEATTYAVVLTERLVGLDGQPVRSPWQWVNHTRQTPDLEPLRDALPGVGLTIDDVAFAWSFTTGTPTRDLHDVVAGLYLGTGPYGHLAAAYPPDITEAATLHTIDGLPSTFLPADALVAPLQTIGLIPPESFEIMGKAYTTFTAGVVGGSFESPYLLVDKDGDGGDGDESWALDPTSGTVVAAPRRVVFSCAIPKESPQMPRAEGSPWPIAIHGHGLGSTRIEFIAFAWALNRVGIAACGIDAPGHGLDVGDDYGDIAAALFSASQAEALWWHLTDDRVRDLDNNGEGDASVDQFTADLLHTRDMIRQPIVDWTQFMRALEGCGTGTMDEVEASPEGNVPRGRTLDRCDWDGDGEVDLGGPGTRFFYDGVSMGGLEGGIAAAALPNLEAAVLTVPGGGLFDVGLRTDIGSVSDGLAGRALTPLITVRPSELGGFDVVQQVISWDDAQDFVVAHVDQLPIGGRVVVHNDTLGTSEAMRIPASRLWRLPIGANVPDAAEKALLAGIPEGGVLDGDPPYGVQDNVGLGDRLRVEIFTAAGALVDEIDTFDQDVVFEGVTYSAGSPLVALSWGLGLHRGSSDLRQVVGVLSMGGEPGDPIAYAHQWTEDPVWDEPTEVLIALTVGDTTVPIAAGVALARAAGIVDFTTSDPRYGTSVDRYLIDKEVMQSQEEFGSYVGPDGSRLHYDPDDLDNGINPYGEPTNAPPLRLTVEAGDGVHGLRFLYVNPRGSHAYFLPDQSLPFDVNTFGAQQMAQFLATGGAEVSDAPCLATPECPFLRPLGDL